MRMSRNYARISVFQRKTNLAYDRQAVQPYRATESLTKKAPCFARNTAPSHFSRGIAPAYHEGVSACTLNSGFEFGL